MTMDGGDTKAQFTLQISVFKDKDYLLPYGIKEFPLRVSLSKPLYVQVKSLAREHCVVFLGKTLYCLSASLHPGVHRVPANFIYAGAKWHPTRRE